MAASYLGLSLLGSTVSDASYDLPWSGLLAFPGVTAS